MDWLGLGVAGLGALGGLFSSQDDDDKGYEVVYGYQNPALANALAGSLQGALGPVNQLNPYIYDVVDLANQNLQQQFERHTMPMLADRAIAAGGFGGSRQGVAEGLAAEGLAEAMAQQQAGLLSAAYGQELAHQQAAWNAANSQLSPIGTVPTNNLSTLEGILGGGLSGYGLYDALKESGLYGSAPVVSSAGSSPLVTGGGGAPVYGVA